MKSIDYLLKAYGVAKESKKDELFFSCLMYNVPTKQLYIFHTMLLLSEPEILSVKVRY